ncbi:GSCOCG00007713001-RA-CDS [Cotesia congregata]|nr:GSCOCG00007713001-RA-CDS [Cotesia congregata]
MRVIRRSAHRVPPGEISMCIRRVLPNTVSEPANPVRETAPETAIFKNSVIPGDRAAILRPTGRKNPDRNPDPGHAAQRQQF